MSDEGDATQVSNFKPVDYAREDFGSLYDELPLWSAPFGQMLLERIPLRTHLTVLDVGAGTGFMTVEIAQRCGPQTLVIAVDPWAAAIRRLRWKTEQLGLTNVQLIEQDAATVDLRDASVDLIVSNLGINNFNNANVVLSNCFRIARKGARLCLTTNLVGHMHEFYDVYRSTLVNLGLTDHLSALDEHINHRSSVDGIREMLANAGFRVLDVAEDSFQMRFANGSSLLRHHFIRLGFLDSWKAVVPDEWVTRTFAALEQNLNAFATDHGSLSLTIPMACIEAHKPG